MPTLDVTMYRILGSSELWSRPMSLAVTSLLARTLIGAGILFIIAYLGNRITFSNRFVNALVTALVFAAFFGAFIFTVDTAVQPPELQ